MTKAEERAFEFLPTHPNAGLEKQRKRFRQMYVAGYEQAEKDNVLTIEDIERLHTFLYAVKNNKSGCFTFTRLSDEQYQEVLKRFNAVKNEI